jgi:hypothetical protein
MDPIAKGRRNRGHARGFGKRSDGSLTNRSVLSEHHLVPGRLHYTDPFWGAIQLSTPGGPSSF